VGVGCGVGVAVGLGVAVGSAVDVGSVVAVAMRVEATSGSVVGGRVGVGTAAEAVALTGAVAEESSSPG